MKKLLSLFFLFISLSQISFAQLNNSSYREITSDLKGLTDDFMKWYSYTFFNIRLSRDFIGLDVDSSSMDKPAFLKKMLSGEVFAYKTSTIEGRDVYKLYPLTSKDENIKNTIKEMASTEMRHNKIEGTEIPAFNFTDINGNNYTNSSTKGKLVVLKCWFIHCVPCIMEMPELNKLVDDHKGNDNILFISLALDNKEELTEFLKTKQFKYAVVPEMKEFINKDLNTTHYPTHLLIDGNGKIVKVVNRIEDLVPFLDKALAKSLH